MTLHQADAPHGLRARLLDRVEDSQRRESQFSTVRRDDSDSVAMAPGVGVRVLHRTPSTCSMLVELAPCASLQPQPPWTQCELVVLAGNAHVDGIAVPHGDAALVPWGVWAARTEVALGAGIEGATLYLRASVVDRPCRRVEVISVSGNGGWDPFAPGVFIRELWNGGERRSVLVRMQAGARVNAHVHALDEECMMLGGEAFIGDTLLRHGEFQWAPQGSRHGEIHTDVGALFFVHGSLDPADYL